MTSSTFFHLFLLLYVKLVYQFFVLYHCIPLRYIKGGVPYSVHVSFGDMNTPCSSSKHALVIVPSLLVFVIFNLFRTLLLVFYPFRIIRRCLSKCKLDSLFLTTFVEKFHGCYRDGLNGGRDMRSFSGLHFIMVFVISLFKTHHTDFVKLRISVWQFSGFIFLLSAVLIASMQPYREKYMNILDTLLLIHLNIISILLSREYFPDDGTQFFIVLFVPQVVFGLLLLYKICAVLKDKIGRGYCKSFLRPSNDTMAGEYSEEEKQPLINPTLGTV